MILILFTCFQAHATWPQIAQSIIRKVTNVTTVIILPERNSFACPISLSVLFLCICSFHSLNPGALFSTIIVLALSHSLTEIPHNMVITKIMVFKKMFTPFGTTY